jgi:hypothetical protein
MNGRVDLNSLGEALRRQYAGTEPRLAVQVSNAGHLLTVLPAASEATIPSESGLKNPTRDVPKGKAFELYISLESPASTACDQRIVPPVQADATLAMEEGRRVQMWTLPGPAGDLIIVRLRLGEDMTADDSRRLLQTVKRAILP